MLRLPGLTGLLLVRLQSRKLCVFDHIWVRNGSEVVGRLVDLWAFANGATMEFSHPGKPTDNAFIGSFNGNLRDECLNVHWFDDLTDAKEKLQVWWQDYNESRPNRSLDDLSPLEFRARWA